MSSVFAEVQLWFPNSLLTKKKASVGGFKVLGGVGELRSATIVELCFIPKPAAVRSPMTLRGRLSNRKTMSSMSKPLTRHQCLHSRCRGMVGGNSQVVREDDGKKPLMFSALQVLPVGVVKTIVTRISAVMELVPTVGGRHAFALSRYTRQCGVVMHTRVEEIDHVKDYVLESLSILCGRSQIWIINLDVSARIQINFDVSVCIQSRHQARVIIVYCTERIFTRH